MASSSPRSADIDAQLTYIAGTLIDLTEAAQTWDDEPVHVKQTWSMEWRNDMDTVALLQEQAERRALTVEQQARLDSLLVRIQELLPTIQRLGLDVPRVALKA